MDNLDTLRLNYERIIIKELGTGIKVVFGEGNINARIVLIGEAPGEKEEETGRAFVGAAGKKLDEFLEIIKLNREDIYITNVVKIRLYRINADTGRKSNRPPTKREIEISMGTLWEQLKLIKPEVVVTLGNIPLRAILEAEEAKIGEYHGRGFQLKNFILFPLYHPASIIYKKSLYDTYIEDIHKLNEYLDSRNMGVK